MVLPSTTVLKRKHSLHGLDLLPLLHVMKDEDEASFPKSFARVSSDVPLEEMSVLDMKEAFAKLAGHSADEVLELLGREGNSVNHRLLLHHAILYANEKGQPKGQDLGVSFLFSFNQCVHHSGTSTDMDVLFSKVLNSSILLFII